MPIYSLTRHLYHLSCIQGHRAPRAYPRSLRAWVHAREGANTLQKNYNAQKFY